MIDRLNFFKKIASISRLNELFPLFSLSPWWKVCLNFSLLAETSPQNSPTRSWQFNAQLQSLAHQVVSYHFCQAENAPTCSVPEFIHSMASQLVSNEIPYRIVTVGKMLMKNIGWVWKFHNFPATQILREINFGEFRSSKTAIF